MAKKFFFSIPISQPQTQIKTKLAGWSVDNLVFSTSSSIYKVKKVECIGDRSTTRAITNGNLQEVERTVLAKNTFYNDAVVAWNLAPDSIKKCATIWSAKKHIKEFVKK